MPFIATLPTIITSHWDWVASLLVVVAGLFVYGLGDLLRTRPGRIWAIGTVCFRDAIRRRVLWITPLAMLGIILIGQFQKPFDELDAVRQTIAVCLFTTGLVVVIIALVTAATNLPREIDNRVIFTIVTKPVSRLEIVLGKVVGFGRVSAVMLLVMGAFTFIYLKGQELVLQHRIDAALASASTEDTRRVWLKHFSEQGLLDAEKISTPVSMRQYARPPQNDDDNWIVGGAQDAVIRILVPENAMVSAAAPDAGPGAAGVGFLLNIGFEPVRGTAAAIASTNPAKPAAGPSVSVQLLDPSSGSVVMSAEQLGKGSTQTLVDPTGTIPVVVQIAPERAKVFGSAPVLDVQLVCSAGDFLYHITRNSVKLLVPDSATTPPRQYGSEHEPLLRGSIGRNGQQLAGPGRGVKPVAIYSWRNAPVPSARSGRVPFEMQVGVEASGNEGSSEVAGTLEMRAFDRKSRKLSPPAVVYPENKHAFFFDLPEEFVSSGDFDLQVRNRTTSHNIGLLPGAVSMVAGREPFAFNLAKGLLVLWLLSLLTATVAFWCSTFLSWPIAVVLSTLIILGHWGVSNVDLSSGIGAQVANDFVGNSNAEVASVVNKSVEQLSHTLTLVSSVLPDITVFGVTDRIEKGTALTGGDMIAPLGVLVLFGLPLITVAYVFLRNKEVAP